MCALIAACSSESVAPSDPGGLGPGEADVIDEPTDAGPMDDVATFDGGFVNEDADLGRDAASDAGSDSSSDASDTAGDADSGLDAVACTADWQCGPTDIACVGAVRTIVEPSCVDGFCGVRTTREEVCEAPGPRCDGDEVVVAAPACGLDDDCIVEETRTPCPVDAPCADGACADVAPPLEASSFKGVRLTAEDVDAAIDAGVGQALVGLDWQTWQPVFRAPPCTSGWVAWEGACFVTDRDAESTLQALTEAGVRAIGAIAGTPEWAREPDCPDDAGATCGPADPADFARFAGYLAWRYRGLSSAGGAQIDDYVIWPSANDSASFVSGPVGLSSTHRRAWVALFVSAFDAIREHRPTATVRAALSADVFTERRGADRGEEWLEALSDEAEERAWDVAVTPAVLDTDTWTFGPDDAPVTTPGTVNRVAGWLAARWPERTPGLLVFDTVFSSTVRFDPAVQSRAVCAAYQQMLATPGIDGFVYGAWRDAFESLDRGELYGLADIYGDLRESGTLWASMDAAGSAQCGFEHGDRVRLQQWREPGGLWWATPRMTTATYQELDAWWMLGRESSADRVTLYDCYGDATGHYLTDDPTCGGDEPRGAIGCAFTTSGDGRVPLVQCRDGSGRLRVSDALDCEGDTAVTTLGWGTR